jgi:hypothetical protein
VVNDVAVHDIVAAGRQVKSHEHTVTRCKKLVQFHGADQVILPGYLPVLEGTVQYTYMNHLNAHLNDAELLYFTVVGFNDQGSCTYGILLHQSLESRRYENEEEYDPKGYTDKYQVTAVYFFSHEKHSRTFSRLKCRFYAAQLKKETLPYWKGILLDGKEVSVYFSATLSAKFMMFITFFPTSVLS